MKYCELDNVELSYSIYLIDFYKSQNLKINLTLNFEFYDLFLLSNQLNHFNWLLQSTEQTRIHDSKVIFCLVTDLKHWRHNHIPELPFILVKCLKSVK